MARDYEVTIVNPTNNPSRRRRRRTTRSAAPRRRRRRATSNPAPAPVYRRRRGRSNPSIAGFGFTASMFSDTALRLLGKLAGAFAVKALGHDGTAPDSETTGKRWTLMNHVLNIGGGMVAGWAIGGLTKSARARQMVLEGAVDQSVQKAFWSELVHRTEAGPKWLGQASEGDVLEDGRGQSWIRQGGRWVTLMGGGMRGLSERSALDGLEYANAMGRSMEWRRRRGIAGLGHLMPSNSADDPAARTGPLINSGAVNPYQAAYM